VVGTLHNKEEDEHYCKGQDTILIRSHKFGIELPKSVKDALAINRPTITTYWKDAIDLEVKNADVSFQELEENEKVPIGYQLIRCHMIFKVGRLKRQARYCAGGHTTYSRQPYRMHI
jgi:hypothetical protein